MCSNWFFKRKLEVSISENPHSVKLATHLNVNLSIKVCTMSTFFL